MKMKAEKREISVVGLGYIGLPTAVVLAQAGHLVKGYDVNPSVRESLSEGRIHIVENHLQEAFSAVQQSGNLRITSELEPSQIYILCVPTPFWKERSNARISAMCVPRPSSSLPC